MSETRVSIGDEVRVFDVNARAMCQPEGGWVGRVTKVGRKLVTIKYDGTYGGEDKFRLKDGSKNDQWGHRWFLTMQEFDHHERKRAALETLRSVGLSIERTSSLTLEQLEQIADVVKGCES